jgi:hypothetical protein
MRRAAACILSKERTSEKWWSRLGVVRMSIYCSSYEHDMSFGSLRKVLYLGWIVRIVLYMPSLNWTTCSVSVHGDDTGAL